jgi:hypothetical protein
MATYYTADQLRKAGVALSRARQTFDCPKPRTDASGTQSRVKVTDPKKLRGRPETEIAYGTHGAAFLEIDIQTLKIRCGACAGTQSAIVTE